MKVEFDPEKDALNKAKHGVSLADGIEIFNDDGKIFQNVTREKDGEIRYRVVGYYQQKLFSCVYVIRGEVLRFISVRRRNKNEEREYRKQNIPKE